MISPPAIDGPLNAKLLATQIYEIIQALGPPTPDNLSLAIAALAHVTGLVLTTNTEVLEPLLKMFLTQLLKSDNLSPTTSH